MQQEHPFAPYVRILGKGKKGSRSLSTDEACAAMGMILDGQVRPEQLGAFLMLIRMKEETPEELQGFALAVKQRLEGQALPMADLDWPTYAGKKRHLPWFFLSALVLAGRGVRVFMHGARGHTPGRIYTEDLLPLFGLTAADSWTAVGKALDTHNLAFHAIDQMVPVLGQLIGLRPVLGLRSPVHTLCRMLNPLNALCSVDGVFHPPYAPMHQRTAQLLGTPHSLTIRGDGGEAEAKPDADTELHWVTDGSLLEETWPRIEPRRLVKDEQLDPVDLLRLWRGEISHDYGEGAVISTLALILRLLSQGEQRPQAHWLEQAREAWQQRDRNAY